MQHSVRPIFLIFFGAVLGLCAAAGAVAFNWVVRRMISKAWPPRWLKVMVRIGIVALPVVMALGVLYGFYVEPYWVKVERVHITCPKLPRGMCPIRIIQISDLHSDAWTRCEDQLPQIIAAERPFLIAFTGDAVNSPDGVPTFNRCIGRIAMLAPTFVSYGGNDEWYAYKHGLFKGTSVRELNGKVHDMEVAGMPIVIAGVAGGRHIPKELRERSDALTVLLCHYPEEAARAVAGSNVDLCLAGNTHGGQVCLPFYGSVCGSERDRRYLGGLYRVDRTWLYVNRGIGMSNAGPAMRFGARPEVTVIEISPPE